MNSCCHQKNVKLHSISYKTVVYFPSPLFFLLSWYFSHWIVIASTSGLRPDSKISKKKKKKVSCLLLQHHCLLSFWYLMKVLVAQSCPTLCDPMDCSPPGSSVQWVLQTKILEWVAIPFSRRSSRARDWTWVSCLAGRFFTIWNQGSPGTY